MKPQAFATADAENVIFPEPFPFLFPNVRTQVVTQYQDIFLKITGYLRPCKLTIEVIIKVHDGL